MPTKTTTRRTRALAGLLALLTAITVSWLATARTASAGPATGAAAVVPADVLAYLNVSTDPGRPAVPRALSLAAHFDAYPVAGAEVLTRLTSMLSGGTSTDYSRDVRPWLGGEAAVALLSTGPASAGSLIVLDVRNRARARSFLARSGAQTSAGNLYTYPVGTEVAFTGHFLLLGAPSVVGAALDVAAGRAPSLAHDPGFRSAGAGEPSDRVLDLYFSPGGLHRVLGAQHGLIQMLGALLSRPGLNGVSLTLSPVPGGARLRLHQVFDPAVASLGNPTRAFVPTLASVFPAGTTLLFDTQGLDRLAPSLLGAGAAAGIGGRIAPLLERLGGALAAEGVDVSAIAKLFDGESAVAITPGATPALTILARTHNPTQAAQELAALQSPLEQLFPAPVSGPGQAPLFQDRMIDGVDVHQLALEPGLGLDYAVFGGVVAVSTSLEGIDAVAAHKRSLANAQPYKSAFPGRPGQVRSLTFLNFTQLLSLGEQMGLLQGARYDALRGDLAKIRTIGLYSSAGEADTTAELFLQIP